MTLRTFWFSLLTNLLPICFQTDEGKGIEEDLLIDQKEGKQQNCDAKAHPMLVQVVSDD